MNYANHYDRLITRARGRVLFCYRERHHVIPKCMGGDNSKANIVELMAEEHYVAHQLLVKMYPGHAGLSLSAVRMAKQCVGNKAYAWLRKRHAKDARARELGTKHSPEHNAKISASLVGRIVTAETRAKIAKANTGKWHSPETRAKISAVQAGKKHGPMSLETRAKIAKAHLGMSHSAETRAKLSALNKGKGRPHTPEARAKISLAAMGNKRSLGKKMPPRSAAHCANISAGRRRRLNQSSQEAA